MPVLHFGMTGMLKVRFSPARSIDVPISMPLGQRPPNPTVQIQGRRLSRRLASTICKGRTLFSSPFVANFNQRILQFILFIQENDSGFTELAFCDARRLGRIRVAFSPLNEPPISELGFDPILSMPSLRDFRDTVSKRTCPIKALLLDQSFSAGVGNYLAGSRGSIYTLIHAHLYFTHPYR